MSDLFGEHRCSKCPNDGRYYAIGLATWLCGICDAAHEGPSIRASDLPTFMVWAVMAANARGRSGDIARDEMRDLLSKRGITFV